MLGPKLLVSVWKDLRPPLDKKIWTLPKESGSGGVLGSVPNLRSGDQEFLGGPQELHHTVDQGDQEFFGLWPRGPRKMFTPKESMQGPGLFFITQGKYFPQRNVHLLARRGFEALTRRASMKMLTPH